MRARRGAPAVGPQCQLPWSQDPPVEPAPRASPSGAQSSAALSQSQRDPGGHQRVEPVFIAPGPGRVQGGRVVIATRRLQRSFADGLIADEVTDLWEPWMRHADEALDDDQLLEIVHAALAKRYKKSKTRGRPSATAEVILRLLLLKHIRDWSYVDLEREVRANLVYREFTRIGAAKVPDNKSISRFGRQLGAEAIQKLHQRVVAIAQQNRVVQGRKLRVDTTVVETNIHYPTDSTLLNDGVRVLTRVMKKVTAVAGEAGTKLRDRTRSVKRRILEIARASRDK